MNNPYTNPNATLSGAASDQELGRQTRERQMATEVANMVAKEAYDKGRYDTEASLADMLYKQVYAPQQADAYVSPEEPVQMSPQDMLDARQMQSGGDISPIASDMPASLAQKLMTEK